MPRKRPKRNDSDSSYHPYKGNLSPTSTTLIVQIRDGESVAWSRFMELYTPLIRYWCRKPGGKLTRLDRQDITQEALAKVGKSIKDFDEHREGRSLRAWLRTITQHTIADFLDKNEKRKDVSQLMSDTGPHKHPGKEAYNKPFELVEDSREKIVLLRQVLKAVKLEFSREQWEVINLFVNAEKTSPEVAEAMNMKPDAVRKIKSRILKRIREEYAKLGLDDDLPAEVG